MNTIQKQITDVGQKVRFYRKLRGYSQEELSDATGLNRTYISAIERGDKNISIKTSIILSLSLNIHISQLFLDELPYDYPNY
ncbi:MAG: helix-turn-helix domain-containing protein [Turicibacter sp.]